MGYYYNIILDVKDKVTAIIHSKKNIILKKGDVIEGEASVQINHEKIKQEDLGFKRVDEVLDILIPNDFIFNSKNLKKYYVLYNKLFYSDKLLVNSPEYRERMNELNNQLIKSLRRYVSNYQLNGRTFRHSFFINALLTDKSLSKDKLVTKKESYHEFLPYFKYFIKCKVFGKEINKKILKNYQKMIKKLRKEYELLNPKKY